MLLDPEAFERLAGGPWDEVAARRGIAAIVARTEDGFDGDRLWPAQEWDAWTLARWRESPERPDAVELPPTPEASLLCGESGILLAAPPRHSLFTGDIGAALFASDCLDAWPRYPLLGGLSSA